MIHDEDSNGKGVLLGCLLGTIFWMAVGVVLAWCSS